MKLLSQLYQEKCETGALFLDPTQQAILPLFDQLMQDLQQQKRRWFSWLRGRPPRLKGIYIWGKVGRGKTLLMDLFEENCPVSSLREHFNMFLYQHFFSTAKKRHFFPEEDAVMMTIRELTKKARVLCLDEFRVNHISDAMLISRVLSQAFQEGVILVATSNVHPQDLYLHGLHRERFIPFIEMLMDHVHVVCIEGSEDYRMNQVGIEGLYLSSLEERTPQILEKIWEILTTGASPTPGEIKHQGRIFHVSRLESRVAWASFQEMCGVPLGASDYNALIQQISYFILSDIPDLLPHQFNEASRFITLIDLLYEAKITTVFSGAVLPLKLYLEGPVSEAFERTRSRLEEMKSWKMPWVDTLHTL